jgi:hypothetical protein
MASREKEQQMGAEAVRSQAQSVPSKPIYRSSDSSPNLASIGRRTGERSIDFFADRFVTGQKYKIIIKKSSAKQETTIFPPP